MRIVGYSAQTPIILLTGFLGSGKTTLLSQMLTHLQKQNKRAAVIQNEFAQTSIDGDILRQTKHDFELRELNTGSIFCACLFSQFKHVLIELAQKGGMDYVIIEATGIADPIAVAQLLEDPLVTTSYYLSSIVSVVDAPRFAHVLSRITGVKHQIQVADLVLVNKVDLVGEPVRTEVKELIHQINPLASIVEGVQAEFDLTPIFGKAVRSQTHQHPLEGALTKCGEGNYLSKTHKSTQPVSQAQIQKFLDALSDQVLRLKGYFTLDDGRCMILQYVPGQIQMEESKNLMRQTELVAIGYELPPFELLNS